MADIKLEIAKTQATINNLIEAYRRHEEGKADVDVLGSLLVLQDKINDIDNLIE